MPGNYLKGDSTVMDILNSEEGLRNRHGYRYARRPKGSYEGEVKKAINDIRQFLPYDYEGDMNWRDLTSVKYEKGGKLGDDELTPEERAQILAGFKERDRQRKSEQFRAEREGDLIDR
jgi:hypothetical protein